MTLPAPPGPPYPPHTLLVARAWLTLALPFVGNGDKRPKPDQDGVRTVGFLRVLGGVGGSLGVETPMRRPVVTAECWVAPPTDGSPIVQENAAEGLAQWVVDATFDPALMGRKVELTAFGQYAPARVHTVIALGSRKVEGDPSNFARFDVDLQINWTGA